MQGILLKMLLNIAVKMLEKMITKENVQVYGDKIFDLFEEFIQDSETDIDDKLFLPAIRKVRVLLDIPDFPDD